MRKILFALLLFSVVFSTQVTLYYGSTCYHCANTEALLSELGSEYEIELIEKEVSSDTANRAEMFGLYGDFGLDPNHAGVPTLLVEDKALIIGELTETQWRALLDACT
jgi:glutaredoxin